jgi:hypothetical protein
VVCAKKTCARKRGGSSFDPPGCTSFVQDDQRETKPYLFSRRWNKVFASVGNLGRYRLRNRGFLKELQAVCQWSILVV